MTNVRFFGLFLFYFQIILKDKQFFLRAFGEEWYQRTEGTGVMEGIFPVTLSYNLKGNSMRLSFSGLVLKTIDDAVVWDTRNRKRGAAAAALPANDEVAELPAKKMRAAFCLTSTE